MLRRLLLPTLVGLALLLVGTCAFPLSAAITTLRLPAEYSDFCIHPVTGDVAAISLTDAHVHLFRSADLAAGKKEPAAKVRVGSSPRAICYKQYDKLELFAVACHKDSYLYLIDAKTGALQRKVDLPGIQVNHVAASLDPQDPYVFYFYGEKSSGLVSLKDYKSHELMFLEGGIDAISARGSTAYITDGERRHRGGFRGVSLARDDSFLEMTYAADSEIAARHCLPDPFDRFVALGSQIYMRALSKREAELNFTPLCFLQKKPLLFGVVQDREVLVKEKSCVVLQAASYNTFTATGKAVVLEPDATYPAVPNFEGKVKPDPEVVELLKKELPPGMPLEIARDNSLYKLQVLADEPRGQLIVAYRSRLDIVPIAEFQAPHEPLLLANLESPKPDGQPGALAGREWNGTLELLDPTAEHEFNNLPTGMKAEGLKLKWTPTAEQLGPQKFGVTLKHKDTQRLLSLELNVSYPSVNLPFLPSELGISPDGSVALVTNAALARWQLQRGDREPNAQPELALLDLKTGKVLAEKKLGTAMRIGGFAQNAVVMITQENPERCEVLNAKTLAREKTISPEANILSVASYGKLLLLHTELGLEFYDPTTFQLVRRLNTNAEYYRHEVAPVEFNAAGLNIWGVRYDQELKPQLFQKNFVLPSFNNPDTVNEREMHQQLLRRRREFNGGERERPRQPGNQVEREIVGVTRETKDGVVVDAVLRQKESPEQTGRHERQTLELTVSARGQATGTQLLARKSIPLNRSSDLHDVLLELSPTGDAYVEFEGRLYRWKIPKVMPEQLGTGNAAKPLEFVPRQSAFQLSGTGQTTLKHEVHYGKTPYRFSLTQERPGMTIDEKTGVVTLDDKTLLAAAAARVESGFADEYQGDDGVQEAADFIAKNAAQALGLKPKGYGFAIPVEVTVQDAQQQESTLNYYVLADLPLAPLQEKYKKVVAERKAELALERERINARERQAMQPAGGDLEAALKRIDALEQRLDLTTRQLNQILKLLDEKNAKP